MFLGPQIGLRECPTCAGKVQLKVFQCGHPQHQETTLNECGTCYDFEQALAKGSVTRWAVGILADRDSEAATTQASLEAAGWQQTNVTHFAPREESHSVPATTQPLGLWSRFYLGLTELYQRSPLAEAFFLARAGVRLPLELRQHLESQLWPRTALGCVLLVESSADSNSPQWNRIEGQIPPFRAGIFPNAAVRLFLGSRQAIDHRLRPEPQSLAGIEAVLEAWSHDHGLDIYALSFVGQRPENK